MNNTPRQPIDLLIEARWVIPVEPSGLCLEDHAVAVHDGRIVAVLPQAEARTRFDARITRSLPRHTLIPGLVNLHTHAAMNLLRGLADDLPLMDWLQQHIWPAEQQHVTPQFVYDGTRLACAEMLLGGTTCFNDMYFFPQQAAEAALAAGMRAALGLVVMDFPTRYAAVADEYLEKGLAVRDALRDNALLSFTLAPHAPYTVGDQTFNRVATMAEQYRLPIHLHLHETRQELQDSVAQFGVRPLARLDALGVVGPRLIAAHGVHLNNEEIELLARRACALAHCPTSNLKLASGIAPLAALDRQGVTIGLGSDGAASNNRLDMFAEMRLAALLAKGHSGLADAIPAARALHLATLGGARALGLGDHVGSIETGKAADLCAVDLHALCLTPRYNPLSLLAYAAGREHVTDVWVAGMARVCDRQLCDASEIELITLADSWQNKVCRRSH